MALTGAGLRGLAEEQEALRRVATLVARGVPPEEVFASVTEELARLLLAEIANLVRFESDGTFTMLASEGGFPVGSRWQIGGKNPTTTIFETGRPARSDDYADHATGPQVGIAREAGLRSTVGVPIIVEGRLWGAIGVGSNREATLPPDTEARLGSFTELVATAIANADSRAELARLAEQQAALRRVATLVAQGVPPEELFAAVAEEIVNVLPVRGARIGRYESDGTVTCVAAITEPGAGEALGASRSILIGKKLPLGGNNLATVVFETGRPVRLEYDEASGPIVGGISEFGGGSGVGTPIVVDGRLWGLATAGSTVERPLPRDTEARLTDFTELVATAIANAESRAGLARLAEEQAALRRVATLVAQSVPPEEVFAAVTEEVARLLVAEISNMVRYEPHGAFTIVGSVDSVGVLSKHWTVGSRWPLGGNNTTTLVFETGRPARIETFDQATGEHLERVREVGFRSAVAVPIIVQSRLWGVIGVATTRAEPLPADTEARLSSFTELVATAIANAEGRGELARLAVQQAALRRVATLVARGVPPEELFAAVAEEIVNVLPVRGARIGRYEPDGTVTFVATIAEPGAAEALGSSGLMLAGKNQPLGGNNLATVVFETGRPVRLEYDEASGPIVGGISEFGGGSGVGTPIVVDGRLWGLATAGTTVERPLPPDTEVRLTDFTELVATAIANAESRAGLARLAEEQAALRRVATLVARGTSPHELFAAVVDEVGRVFSVENVGLARYEPDGTMTTLAISARLAESLPVGGQWPLGGHNVSTVVSQTGRSARIDRYGDASGRLGVTMREQGFASAVGAPIVVEGDLWGLMTLASTEQLLPTDAEERLVSFTELAAAAIANTESRAGLARLAEEQAALRRVATLVAEGAPAAAVFDAVASEMASLLIADGITLVRYEPNDELTVLAHRGPGAPQVPPGTRVRHDGASVSATVRRTQRPARMASYADTDGHIGEVIEGLSFRSGVGAPIVVDGRLWGATIANWTTEEPPPSGTEERIAKFTRLLDTAIANADSRDQLTASRARLVTEAHEARRHVVRDLHDGAQQGLVHTIIALKLAHRALDKGQQNLAPLVSEALEYAETANDELRELVHGILPSVLTREGLRAGVEELAARMSIPIEIDVGVERLPPVVEATAYFVVAGALTNVVKHAHAQRAEVRTFVKDKTLYLEVRDDGVGGADPRGPGVLGLSDRVTALDGQLSVESPAQGGTILAATLPLDSQ